MSVSDSSATSYATQAIVGRSHMLWILLACLGLHMEEEHAFNFVAWAASIGMKCSATDLYIVNGGYLLFGLCAAVVGWREPRFSLAFPAHLLLNALFHCGASLFSGRLNPGVLTSVTLLLPFSIACLLAARRDGILTRSRAAWAFGIGALVHSYPFVLLLLRPALSYNF